MIYRLEKVKEKHLRWFPDQTPDYIPIHSETVVITPRARHAITCKLTKEPRIDSKQLKTSFTLIILMFMTRPSGELWTAIVCMVELLEESCCSMKRTLLPVCRSHGQNSVAKWEKNRRFSFYYDIKCYLYRETFQYENSKPIVKHGGGSNIVLLQLGQDKF